MKEQDNDFSKSKAYALRLVKFRPRSQKEIQDKLRKKGFSPETVLKTLLYLKKVKIVDDRLFADLWVKSRIKRHIGLSRLRRELKIKGIEFDIIEDVVSSIGEGYCEEDIVREIVKNRASRMSNLAPDKKRSRLYSYLLRRGYPRGVILQVLFDERIFEGTEE